MRKQFKVPFVQFCHFCDRLVTRCIMVKEYFCLTNLNNSKPFESLKYKKTRPNLNQKPLPKINNYEKINKKGGKKKEGNLQKPLPSFSFFRPLLSLFLTTIYIKKLLADDPVLFQYPLQSWNSNKI